MQKVKVQTTLVEQGVLDSKLELVTTGTLNNKCLTFMDDDLTTTLDLNDQITLIRENNFYKLTFIFDQIKSTGLYILKEGNLNCPIDIVTNKIFIEGNLIVIDYQIDVDTSFTFTLTYEVIE